jgi:hypothetical protein
VEHSLEQEQEEKRSKNEQEGKCLELFPPEAVQAVMNHPQALLDHCHAEEKPEDYHLVHLMEVEMMEH